MRPKAVVLLTLVLAFVSVADAAGPCPLMLISGTAESDAIVVTFRHGGKVPIRQLEFNCTPLRSQAHKPQNGRCREDNALFYPGGEYTVRYTYPGGKREPVRVSVKSVTFLDGTIWRPTKRQPCRVLSIRAPK